MDLPRIRAPVCKVQRRLLGQDFKACPGLPQPWHLKEGLPAPGCPCREPEEIPPPEDIEERPPPGLGFAEFSLISFLRLFSANSLALSLSALRLLCSSGLGVLGDCLPPYDLRPGPSSSEESESDAESSSSSSELASDLLDLAET